MVGFDRGNLMRVGLNPKRLRGFSIVWWRRDIYVVKVKLKVSEDQEDCCGAFVVAINAYGTMNLN